MGKFITFKNGLCEKIDFEETYKNVDSYCRKSDKMYLDNYTTIIEYNNTPYIDIAYSLTKKDYDNIMTVISSFSHSEQLELVIRNHNIRNGFDDLDEFDYYSLKYVMNLHKSEYSEEDFNEIIEKRAPINVVDFYLRNKINMLTEEEKKIYKKYSTFDLESFLFEEGIEKFVINNDNSGFISIFEDCTFKSPNTTYNHSETSEKHMKWYSMGHTGNPQNHIGIRISKGIVTMNIPNDINDYQKQELSNIIEEIDDLCKFHNKEIEFGAEVYVRNDTDEFVPILSDEEVVETYNSLEQLKEKYVIKNGNKNK